MQVVLVCCAVGGATLCLYTTRTSRGAVVRMVPASGDQNLAWDLDLDLDLLDTAQWSFSATLDTVRLSLPGRLRRPRPAEAGGRDRSLNSLLTGDSEQRFIARPSGGRDTEHPQLARSRGGRAEAAEPRVVQRVAAGSRLVHRPRASRGLDSLRMAGDGAEDSAGQEEAAAEGGMEEFLQQAEEVRRLIRWGNSQSYNTAETVAPCASTMSSLSQVLFT